jgi:1-phosphofructokinase
VVIEEATMSAPARSPRRPAVVVFAPTPMLTITVEESPRRLKRARAATGDIHLHAGGQGFWIARMLAELDVAVTLCGSFGGETGAVLREIIPQAGVTVAATAARGANGAYVHDRRGGERTELATMPADELTRHDLDELYGVTLVEALAAGTMVLTGPECDGILPDEVYRRLAVDARTNGCQVIADLSGGRLAEALAGGLDVLKVSTEELHRDGRLPAGGSLRRAAEELRTGGAEQVVITLGDERSVVFADGRLRLVTGPRLEPVDVRGAGDSLTAGITAGLSVGMPLVEAVTFGAAAGALNVTRRGLASGVREQIQRLAERVAVDDVDDLDDRTEPSEPSEPGEPATEVIS